MTSPTSATSSVLIFRTVSVEKLDGVLAACRTRWPDLKLAVLSSAARREELLADPRVSEVIVAEPGTNGYGGDLKLERRFAAIVVPIGNRSGTGYANVLRVAASCSADEYLVAPYAAELRATARRSLRLRALVEEATLALCLPFGWLAALGRFRR